MAPSMTSPIHIHNTHGDTTPTQLHKAFKISPTPHRPISQFSLTKKIDPFHNPRGGSKGHGENSFFFETVLLRQSMWQWWRLGVKEAEEAEVNGVKEVEAMSENFFFF